jgi:hypothetical protein
MKQPRLTPTLGQVRAWLDCIGGANVPEQFVYHRGYLALDRGRWHVAEDGKETFIPCEEVDEAARLMWAAHEAGTVVLTQRRLAPREWLYIAIRSTEVRRKQWLSKTR